MPIVKLRVESITTKPELDTEHQIMHRTPVAPRAPTPTTWALRSGPMLQRASLKPPMHSREAEDQTYAGRSPQYIRRFPCTCRNRATTAPPAPAAGRRAAVEKALTTAICRICWWALAGDIQRMVAVKPSFLLCCRAASAGETRTLPQSGQRRWPWRRP